MKRLFVISILFFIVLSGCAKQNGIIIWSFNDELQDMINNHYNMAFTDVKTNYTAVPADQFKEKLDTVLLSGKKTPDIFTLDAASVSHYAESGLLLDLTDIYEKTKSGFFPYSVDIGTHDGRVYGMSWHVCPGAMFYRRSLARKYLGSDDPAFIQTQFSDFGKFLVTAELLNRRSSGSCVVVSSCGDLYDVFLGARAKPWITDGSLNIDPAMELYMDMSKTIYDNRLDGRVNHKSEGWYAGLSGNLKDENANPLEVFSYFLPVCGLNNIIKVYAPDSLGDWGMIPGPVSNNWCGTFISAYKDTENPEVVLQMIEWLTTDADFLEKWAKEEGRIVNNREIANRMNDSFYDPFLRGQNVFTIFTDIAKNINGSLVQGTDKRIELLFREAAAAFARGSKTKTQALSDFRAQVQRELGL